MWLRNFLSDIHETIGNVTENIGEKSGTVKETVTEIIPEGFKYKVDCIERMRELSKKKPDTK